MGIQNFIFLDYILSIMAFISLIPFIYNTFDVLKPSSLIKNLAQDVTNEKIFDYLNEIMKEDPLQPIIDILLTSLIKYDFATLKECLSEIKTLIDIITKVNDLTIDKKRKLNSYLLNHFERIANLAISNNDEDSLKEIMISALVNSRIYDLEWEYDEQILEKTTDFVKKMGDFALDYKMVNVVMLESESLNKIGEIYVKNVNNEMVENIVLSLEKILSGSMKLNLDFAAIKTADCMVNIKKSVIDNEFESFTPIALILNGLYNFIKEAIEEKNDTLAVSLFEKLCKASKLDSNIHIELIQNYSPNAIKELREMALENNMDLTAQYAGECLINIFNSFMLYSTFDSMKNFYNNIIKIIAENAVDEDNTTKQPLISSLKKIVTNMEVKVQLGVYSRFFGETITELNVMIENLEN